MDVTRILSEIDAEIARLQEARSALVGLSGGGSGSAAATGKRRGRPKGSVNVAKPGPVAKTAKKKRNLSPEGRKKIQEAMKRRWAERRKELSRNSK